MSTDRMKIALVLASMAGGGAERVALNLAEEFVRRGHSVELVLLKRKGPLLDKVPDTIRVVDLDSSRARRAVLKLRRYLKSDAPDVVIAFAFHVNALAVLAAAGMSGRPKLLLTVHSSLIGALREASIGRRLSLWAGAAFLYRLADAVVAVSEGGASDLVKAAGLPPAFVTTIHNPVIGPDFEQKAAGVPDHRWFREKRVPVILAAGRLTPAKDYPTLIRAFEIVRERMDARLLILGEGECRGELEAQIAGSPFRDDIDLAGHVDNPLPYMKAADAFVMSSKREGFGNVLVEAMALGTPVVSTDCPHGPREILDGGKWGRLVPVGDVRALAKAIAETLRSGRKDARKHAQTFTVGAAAGRYLALISN